MPPLLQSQLHCQKHPESHIVVLIGWRQLPGHENTCMDLFIGNKMLRDCCPYSTTSKPSILASVQENMTCWWAVTILQFWLNSGKTQKMLELFTFTRHFYPKHLTGNTLMCMFFWKEPMQSWGEHAKSTHKGPWWGFEPSYCEVWVLTSVPQASLEQHWPSLDPSSLAEGK